MDTRRTLEDALTFLITNITKDLLSYNTYAQQISCHFVEPMWSIFFAIRLAKIAILLSPM
jgi:hypothetical protein